MGSLVSESGTAIGTEEFVNWVIDITDLEEE